MKWKKAMIYDKEKHKFSFWKFWYFNLFFVVVLLWKSSRLQGNRMAWERISTIKVLSLNSLSSVLRTIMSSKIFNICVGWDAPADLSFLWSGDLRERKFRRVAMIPCNGSITVITKVMKMTMSSTRILMNLLTLRLLQNRCIITYLLNRKLFQQNCNRKNKNESTQIWSSSMQSIHVKAQ